MIGPLFAFRLKPPMRWATVGVGAILMVNAATAQTTAPVEDIVSIRSTGKPPDDLQKLVSTHAAWTPAKAQYGEAAAALIKRVCGYESAFLAELMLSRNADKFENGNAKDVADVTVPACIMAILESKYVVQDGDSPFTIGRDVMGFKEDGFTHLRTTPTARTTLAEDRFVAAFCEKNSRVIGVATACNPRQRTSGALQKNSELTLPVKATSTDLRLAPPPADADEAARKVHYQDAAKAIYDAADAAGKTQPFRLLAFSRGTPKERSTPLLGSCTDAVTPFDAARVFSLWSSYTPTRKVVVTIVDSGLAPGTPLDTFVYKPSVGGVASTPDSTNAEDFDKPQGEYAAFKDCDDGNGPPEECPLVKGLLGYHGTHVAGLVLGGQEFLAKLQGVTADGQPLSLRIFRALAKVPATVTYDHTNEALTNAFNWAQNRPGHPRHIVHFSVGINKPISGFTLPQVEKNAILFVAAAGNYRRKLTAEGGNPHTIYPALSGGRSSKYFITVGNASKDGKPHLDSNYSIQYVDLFAPGVCLASFDYGGRTRVATGTSQAAPLVTFTAALLRAIDDTFASDPAAVKNRIVDTTDYVELLSELSWSGGLLNIERAIDIRADYVTYGEAGQPPQSARGILLEDPITICGDLRARDFTRFHRLDEKSALYRSSEMSKDSTFTLDRCSISPETNKKTIPMLVYSQSGSQKMDIPVSQIQAITGRYIQQRNDAFMQKTSPAP